MQWLNCNPELAQIQLRTTVSAVFKTYCVKEQDINIIEFATAKCRSPALSLSCNQI